MCQDTANRLITVAIHTYEKAVALRSLLECEGIEVTLQNVNLDHPAVSSGIRVRIHESDLPLALRIIENREILIDNTSEPDNISSHYILVPVDFSEHSLTTVKFAAALASRHKSSLTLLNTFIDPYISGEGIQLTNSLTYDIIDSEARQQVQTAATKAMDEFVKKVKKLMKSGEINAVKIDTEISEGVPEDAISAYAKANPPLLTAMGTRGADQKEKEMIGSVSAEVLDSARYPVITLPRPSEQADPTKPAQILFFCNADQNDILAMDTLLRLFPDAQGNVTLLVLPSRRRWIEKHKPQSATAAMTNYFRQNYPNLVFEDISTDANRAVRDVETLNRKHPYDLIVVPNKKKKNVLGRIFHPSLAHQLIFGADIPMLVIPV